MLDNERLFDHDSACVLGLARLLELELDTDDRSDPSCTSFLLFPLPKLFSYPSPRDVLLNSLISYSQNRGGRQLSDSFLCRSRLRRRMRLAPRRGPSTLQRIQSQTPTLANVLDALIT